MDVWLLYGICLFIAYLTALLWRRWSSSSKANDVPAHSEGISVEESDQELQHVSDILCEEISRESRKVQDISPEKTSVEVPEVCGEEITKEHQDVPEIFADKDTQELHQVSDIVSEEIIQEVHEFPLGESCEESCQVPNIFGEGISQEPQKFAEISQGGNWQELQQVPEIFGKQSSEKVLDSSPGKSCEETHKVPEIFCEEFSREPQSNLYVSTDKNSEEFQQDPQILGEEISRVPQNVVERSLETEEVLQVFGDEINKESVNVPKILSDVDNQVSDVGEVIIQKPQKVLEFSLEKSSQGLQQEPEIFGEGISLDHKKVVEISPGRSYAYPENLTEEFGHESLQDLEVSAGGDSKDLQPVPRILGEAICKEPPKDLDIPLERGSNKFHQVRELLGEGLSQEQETIAEILREESNQELCQVPEFCGEELIEEHLNVPDILADKKTLGLVQISDIVGEEIIQEPQKVLEISKEARSPELQQDLESLKATDVFRKQISQVQQAVLGISKEQNSQVIEISGDEISNESPKVTEVFGEEIIQELQEELGITIEQNSQVPEILDEEISNESPKVTEVFGEEIIQELQEELGITIEQNSQVPEILDEEIPNESPKVTEVFGEEIIQELQEELGITIEQNNQVPEILDEEISNEFPKVTEVFGEEIIQELQEELGITIEQNSQVPEILREEISNESPKVTEVFVQEIIQELQEELGVLIEQNSSVPEILGEEIAQESPKVTEVFGEEIIQESPKVEEVLGGEQGSQVPEILGEEITQESSKVAEVFGGEITQEPQLELHISIEQNSQVPETFGEEITQESPKVTQGFGGEITQNLQEVLGISTEQSSQVPEIFGEGITQESLKVTEVFGEEIIQESPKVTGLFVGEISQEPQEVLDISIEQRNQVPENFGEEITQESSKVTEVLGGKIGQEPQGELGISTEQNRQVPEVLGEEFAKESPEVTEVLGGEISQEPQGELGISIKQHNQVPETFDVEITQESPKVTRVFCGEISQEPQEVLDISIEQHNQVPETFCEEITQESLKVTEVFGGEISQEPQGELGISIKQHNQVPETFDEEITQESPKVTEVFGGEISQEPKEVLDISIEQRNQVPENFGEEITQESPKVAVAFGGEISQEPQGELGISTEQSSQVPDILGEEITQESKVFGGEISPEPQEVLGISTEQRNQVSETFGEEITQESPNVAEVFGGEISQEPQVELGISTRQSSQVPEGLGEEITQESPKVAEVLGEEIGQEPQGEQSISLEQNSQVPEILDEEITQESPKVTEVLGGGISTEQNSQVPEILDEKITQESPKVTDFSGGEIGQEPQGELVISTEQSSQVPDILGEEIAKESPKVSEILGEEINQDSPKVTEVFGEEISQEPQRTLGSFLEQCNQVSDSSDGEITRDSVKVLDISAEEDNQEPEKDFTKDRHKLLVHQLEMTAPCETRFLVLNLNENNESEVFRLEKGWTLKFFLGPTLVNRTVRLFVNHPLQGEVGDKSSYRELEWSKDLPSVRLDVCEGHADVTMIQAGSFRYFFTMDGSDCKDRASGLGFFLVDPDLVIGKSPERLPLDGIICQTVVSKLLGPFPEWEGRLCVAKETGYNVIHFTPLQELGASNSAYALRDQLKLNPVFHTSDRTFTFEDVERLVDVLNSEYGLLSFTDLVLNHTANESPWIFEHPECVYNLVNSPHLKPAYLLDRCLRLFSVNVADGAWASEGIPPTLNSEEHLKCITTVLHTSVLPELRLSEFYQVSVDEILNTFRRLIVDGFSGSDYDESELWIIPEPGNFRLHSTVNMSVAIKLFYGSQTSDVTEDEKIQLAADALRQELERLNARADEEVSEHLLVAVRNFVAHARHRFVDGNGLRLPAVTRDQPIMLRYFVNPYGYLSMKEEETLMHSEKAAYCMAHNGWVYDDQHGNLVEPCSNVYLRRELNAWEDSVKLRYGNTPDDCPYLWAQMHKYAIQTARIFHGIRLDNCHNTPIHVAEWMLAECRAVRPDLYVIAELFTSSKHYDNLYINRLGINSMIQESLAANDARDLGNRIARHSPQPVGAFFQLPLHPLTSLLTHDLLFDQSHDNASIVDQRSVQDVLPNAALVAVARCSIASTRGYDEVVPHHISVITESRLYRSWSTDEFYDSSSCVGIATGIIAAKRALNRLHWRLMSEGFSQMSVEYVTDDVVAVTRHHPITNESIVLVAHTAFRRPDSGTSRLPSFPLQGRLSEVIVEAEIVIDATKTCVSNEKHISGLDNIQLIIQENIDVSESHMVRVQSHDNSQTVEFVQFPASSIIAFRVSLDDSANVSLTHLCHLLASCGSKIRPSGTDANEIVPTTDSAELEKILTELTLSDLNLVLFRCDAEERDDGHGYGVYHVPGFGDLPFCGLAGVMSVLMAIRASNDLNHPLCRNLKEGDWMLDYLSGRLLCHQGTRRLGTWLEAQFGHIKSLPRCLVPCYFDALVTGVFVALEELTWKRMTGFVKDGSAFVRALALASVQVCGVSRSALLPGLSPLLDPPVPATIAGDEGHPRMDLVTIAAGLPHFSSGSFRCWGRDTFISMRGLLLVTGRFDEARLLILEFAGCLRHGLIPNFLGCGSLEPRYNSRDAVWWWLQAIQDYCNMAPDGIALLKDKVSRCYPTEDSSLLPPGACDQLLCDVIQEALQKHASGVNFRECNAGPKIDNDVTSAGFDVEVGVDWTTGFVFGGNEHNCGTWMDKMGSSEAAGNLGKPATPRHGSAVEIVGLCYSAVKWLDNLSLQALFPYSGVSVLQDDAATQITYHSWCELIAKNFEPKFWIDHDPANDPHPELVNRRGIYRDVSGCSHKWSEYQLRPNFAIAIALAPELFNIDHAWAALERAGEVLMGPLGLKTLDPSDWEYSGYYDNSHWSKDYKVACGFSYHQGPEWIWPVGFFLRAMMQVAKQLEGQHAGILSDTLSNVRRILSAHHTFIHVSAWKSLPELTNENGEFCAASCPSQAWSIACILDSLYDAEKITLIHDHLFI